MRPKSVDGVLGIARVHETGGNIVAIDESKHDEHETANTDVEGAFAEKDPADLHPVNEADVALAAMDRDSSERFRALGGSEARWHPPLTAWSGRRRAVRLVARPAPLAR